MNQAGVAIHSRREDKNEMQDHEVGKKSARYCSGTVDKASTHLNTKCFRKKNLRLLHINIQSIRNKTNELEAYLAAKEPNVEVICISEHWLKESELEYLKVSDFTVASFFSRTEFTHGGTLILIKKSLEFRSLNNLSRLSIEKHCEIAAMKIKLLNVIILTIYRSPLGDFNIFINNLEKLLSSVSNDSKIIICGDFNVKFNTGNPQNVTLIDLFKTFGLEQTINDNTRAMNCIDNIFINFSLDDYTSYVSESLLSDHTSQTLEVTIFNPNIKYQKTSRPITLMGKYNFYERLSSSTWEFINDVSLHVNSKLTMLLDTILFAYRESFPEKTLTFKNNKPSQPKWFTNEIRTMRNHLNFLNEVCKQANTAENKKIRNKFRLAYKRTIKNEKIKVNDDIIKKSGNPTKTMWSIINSHKNKNCNEKPNISVNEFNNFFVHIADDIINKLQPTNIDPLKYMEFANTPEPFSFREVSYIEVRDIINSLKNNESRDIYGLNITLLKTIKDLILIPLTNLINECLRTGVFPDALKVACVIPIFKKGNKDDLGNYRPISLLPIISKIFEKVIKNQIVNYLETHKLLNEYQYGFREKLSTSDAILRFTENTLECFEKGMYSASLFCDLSKAFDCVSHNILLRKLQKFYFNDKSLMLISSYLENRRQSVRIEGEMSSELCISAGVPQGSILGPVLFLMYINDLPNAFEKITCLFYADDTTLSMSHLNLEQLEMQCIAVQSTAKTWFASNKLALNETKTLKMISATRDISSVENNPTKTKFLGVFLDPSLNWNAHVDYLSNSLSKNIYALRQLSNSVSKESLRSAYFALFHSRLSYATLAWGHSAGKHRLFGLQRKAVRIVGGVGYRDETKTLYINLKILTFPSIYAFQCLEYVHNHLYNFHTHADKHDYNTRNKNNLYPEFTRLTRAQTGTSYYGIKLYNEIPDYVKILPPTKFKIKLKDFLIKTAYFSIEEIIRNLKNI